MPTKINREEFVSKFNAEGFVVVNELFSTSFIDALIPEFNNAVAQEQSLKQDEHQNKFSILLACPIYGGKFLEVLENENFVQPFNWLLGDTCIVWAYTSTCVPPQAHNKSTTTIHVDYPHFVQNYHAGIGSLILLDDFTEENGATWYLPFSHLQEQQPDEDYFYKHAKRLVAPKGTVFFFNLRLWHASGHNKTDKWRNSLAVGMKRPYFKQRIDLPRAMQHLDTSNLSDFVKQKLGYFAQSPASIEEFYEFANFRKTLQPSEWENKQTY
ncbi:MAG: phytanoyl-CoA dioxygenase family protein [Chitinophagales bacterium]